MTQSQMKYPYVRWAELSEAFFSSSLYLGRVEDETQELAESDKSDHLRILWDGQQEPVAANVFSAADAPAHAICLAKDARGLICLGVENEGLGRLTREGIRYAQENNLKSDFFELLRKTANRGEVFQARRDRRAIDAFNQTLRARHDHRPMRPQDLLGAVQGVDMARALVVQLPTRKKPEPSFS